MHVLTWLPASWKNTWSSCRKVSKKERKDTESIYPLCSRVYGRLLPSWNTFRLRVYTVLRLYSPHAWIFLILLLCTAAYLNDIFPARSIVQLQCHFSEVLQMTKAFQHLYDQIKDENLKATQSCRDDKELRWETFPVKALGPLSTAKPTVKTQHTNNTKIWPSQ